MRIPIAIMTADIHARNTNPACRTDNYFLTLKRKLEYIKARMPEGCVWLDAGDLFHSWKSSPETEVMLIEMLQGVDFFSIPGNHEIPYHNLEKMKESSFQVLCSARVLKYFNAIAPTTPLYSGCSYKIAGVSVAICHGMVWPDKPPMAGMEGIGAKEVMAAFPDCDILLTGHNHQTFVVEDDGRVLVNPGSVMRSAIDQVDHTPCFFILYDDKSVEQAFIPVEADVFADDVYAKKEDREERMQAFLERVQDTSGFSLSFSENVKTYCTQNSVTKEVQEEIYKVMGE
jgi:DNA repair exonuclease SbcCD nuclease subunit